MYEASIIKHNDSDFLEIKLDETWFKQFIKEFNIVIEGDVENYINDNFSITLNDILNFSTYILFDDVNKGKRHLYDITIEEVIALYTSSPCRKFMEEIFAYQYSKGKPIFLRDATSKKYCMSLIRLTPYDDEIMHDIFKCDFPDSPDVPTMSSLNNTKYNRYFNIITKIIFENWMYFIDWVSDVKIFRILNCNNLNINNIVYGDITNENNLSGYKELKCNFVSNDGSVDNITINIDEMLEKEKNEKYNKLTNYFSIQNKIYLDALNESYNTIIDALTIQLDTLNRNIFKNYFDMLNLIKRLGWSIVNICSVKMDVVYQERIFVTKLKFHERYIELPNPLGNKNFKELFFIDNLKLTNITKGKVSDESKLFGNGLHPVFKNINYQQHYYYYESKNINLDDIYENINMNSGMIKKLNSIQELSEVLLYILSFGSHKSIDVYKILEEPNQDMYNKDVVDIIRILVLGTSETIKVMSNGKLRCSISNNKLKEYAKLAYSNFRGVYLPIYKENLQAYNESINVN